MIFFNNKNKSTFTFNTGVWKNLDSKTQNSEADRSLQARVYENRENQVFRAFINSRANETNADRSRLTNIEKISHEKQIFLDLTRDQTELQKSTKEFWSPNSSRLPILSSFSFVNLSLILDSSFLFPRHRINATLKFFKPSVTLKFSECSSLSVECKCNTHTHTQHLKLVV
ncbi:hypothetical protein BpHYR1_026575 [Brachionus plicatilis]|uniref:Uncharacterized protein n=1 Tax=Brachionus plicatilis TaxID=10195 RepID=A0A3M7RFK9_BRAPC|nr:hypothetical protein BpHYR1_026575 [Brachionus plicatilis]